MNQTTIQLPYIKEIVIKERMSMWTSNCLVTRILPNIFFYVKQKKETRIENLGELKIKNK